MKRCVNCKYRNSSRSRGLCWRCFYSPGVKETYPVDAIYGRRGVGLESTGPAETPTDTRPGTEERIRVLEARAAKGQDLEHPEDFSLRRKDL